MKRFICCVLAVCVSGGLMAQTYVPLMVETNGTLGGPTGFFEANSNRLAAVVGGGGGVAAWGSTEDTNAALTFGRYYTPSLSGAGLEFGPMDVGAGADPLLVEMVASLWQTNWAGASNRYLAVPGLSGSIVRNLELHALSNAVFAALSAYASASNAVLRAASGATGTNASGLLVSNAVLRVGGEGGRWEFYPNNNATGSNCAGAYVGSDGTFAISFGTNSSLGVGYSPSSTANRVRLGSVELYANTVCTAPGRGTFQLTATYATNEVVFGGGASGATDRHQSTNCHLLGTSVIGGQAKLQIEDAAGGTNLLTGVGVTAALAQLHGTNGLRWDGWLCLGNTNVVPPTPTAATSNLTYLYTKTSGTGFGEVWVCDGAGNGTQISPHSKDAPSFLATNAPGADRIAHTIFADGRHSWANLDQLARNMDALSERLGLGLPRCYVEESRGEYRARVGVDPAEVKEREAVEVEEIEP